MRLVLSGGVSSCVSFRDRPLGFEKSNGFHRFGLFGQTDHQGFGLGTGTICGREVFQSLLESVLGYHLNSAFFSVKLMPSRLASFMRIAITRHFRWISFQSASRSP